MQQLTAALALSCLFSNTSLFPEQPQYRRCHWVKRIKLFMNYGILRQCKEALACNHADKTVEFKLLSNESRQKPPT